MARNRKHASLKPSSTRNYINWQVDFDYVDKLSPQEYEWFAVFCDEYYHSASREIMSVEQIRERWRAYYKNSMDLLSLPARRVYPRAVGLGAGPDSGSDMAVGEADDFLGFIREVESTSRLDQVEDDLIARIDTNRARARARAGYVPTTADYDDDSCNEP